MFGKRGPSATWASNHDLHYAYSDDGGVSWCNNAGHTIADLRQGNLIELDDPGIVAGIEDSIRRVLGNGGDD